MHYVLLCWYDQIKTENSRNLNTNVNLSSSQPKQSKFALQFLDVSIAKLYQLHYQLSATHSARSPLHHYHGIHRCRTSWVEMIHTASRCHQLYRCFSLLEKIVCDVQNTKTHMQTNIRPWTVSSTVSSFTNNPLTNSEEQEAGKTEQN